MRRNAGLAITLLVSMLRFTPAMAADIRIEQGTADMADGIQIDYTFAHPDIAETQRPVILMTHGWGQSRVTDFTSGMARALVDSGYAVLTWDSRGFGTSGGEANLNAQEFEVRDVQSLISLLADRPDVLLDGPEDPRIGMYGGSYAGSIQLMAAAADARIDAITPQITWNDLPQALKPGGVLKLGWDVALYGSGVATGTTGGASKRQTGSVAPQVHQALAEGVALNDWTSSTAGWFDARSPKHYIGGAQIGSRTLPGISAPTLIIQGTSDTLFNLNHGIANYDAIRARGVPANLVAFCGGHTMAPLGTSCGSVGAQEKIESTALTWFDRYVNLNAAADTGAPIEYQLQDGTFHSLNAFPETTITSAGATRITNTIVPTTGQGFAGTSGGCRPPNANEATQSYVRDCPAAFADWIELTRLAEAADGADCLVFGEPPPPDSGGILPDGPVPPCQKENLHLAAGTRLVGSPRVDLTVSGTGPEAYMFFKMIDYDTVTKTKTVIDDQVTALKITWPPSGFSTRDIRLDLAGISWLVKKDHHIYLEVGGTSNDHASSRTPFTLNVSPIELSVPAIEPAPPAPPIITAPVEGQTISTTAATAIVTVTGTAEPGAIVRIQRYGVREAKVTANAVTGAWSTTIKVKSDQVHPITATQQNADGSVSEKSPPRTFDVIRT